MHYYQFNIGDFASHTAHLEPLEEIAYRRMLDYCYLHEIGLPETVEEIARLVRMRSHCECIATVLREFFAQHPDGSWRSERVDREIAAFKERSNKASQSARKRWENPMRTHTERTADAVPTESEGNANHKPLTINQEPDITTSSVKTDRCPTAQIIELFHTHAPSLVQPKIVPDSVKAQIAARWRESEIHQSLDFWSGFFAYCEQSDFLAGRTDGRGGKPFRAGLEWVVKASSFAKIINGNYHGQGPLL